MEQFLGILLVSLVVAALIGISYLRKKRVGPNLDAFAEAFCEAADHVLGTPYAYGSAWLATETTADGFLRIAPMEQQSELIRELFEKGVDEYCMDRLETMYRQRSKAQETLSGINMFSKRLNPVLNDSYDLLNEFLAFIHQTDASFSRGTLDRFHYFLHEQKHIRNVSLASFVTEGCKQRITLV